MNDHWIATKLHIRDVMEPANADFIRKIRRSDVDADLSPDQNLLVSAII